MAQYRSSRRFPSPDEVPTLRPVSRAEARARGLRRYYTGTPCQWGHDAARYVKTCQCVQCIAERNDRTYRSLCLERLVSAVLAGATVLTPGQPLPFPDLG